jgi:hypothetical protein
MTTTTAHTGNVRSLAYELVVDGDDARPTTASGVYAVGYIGLEVSFQALHSRKKYRIPASVCLLPGPVSQPQT